MSVRSGSALRFFVGFIAALIAVAASAATATALLPAFAPHGARAVIVGTGLDAGTMTVTFASSGGSAPTTIVSRSATLIEIVVPAAAVSGAVNVDVSGATIASLSFTLVPDTAFVRVTTLVAADKAHDVLKNPAAVAILTASGTAVVADTAHHRVVTISAAGQVAVLAGSGKPGFADGTGAQAQFNEPAGIAVDEARKIIYVADTSNNAIRAVTYEGRVSTLVGAQAGLKKPLGLAVDSAGIIYVADSGNDNIKAVTPAGVVTAFAGGANNGFADGAAAQALFKNPGGVAVSSDGVLFVADSENHRVRKIDHGIVSTIAGTGHGGFLDGSAAVAELKQPTGVALDDAGNVYVADSGNHAIRKIANGTVSTVAGTGNPGFTDGTLASAQFKEASGIAFAGALFVADSGNDALRIIDPQLAVSAVYPQTGDPRGGQTVRILGAGFVPGPTRVMFGDAAATEVTFITSTELTATTPAHAVGSVDVAVTTPRGTATLANAFAYAAPPTITSVSPTKGKTAGGETITVSGTNFLSDTTVTLGGLAPASLTVVNGSSLTFTTTAAGVGPADLVVTTSAGSATRAGAFTYFAPPTIVSFSPTQGSAGTVVTISGTNFDPDPAGDTVQIGTQAAAVSSATPMQLVIVAPSGTTGGRITVTTVGGSTTSTAEFSTATVTALEITTPATAFSQRDSVPFNALARFADGSAVDVSRQASWTSSDSSVATTNPSGVVTGLSAGTAVITATYAGFSATKGVTINGVSIPMVVPAPVDRTIVQPLIDTVRFLYTGPNAVQAGVAAGTIEERRVATIRGSVHDRGGAPIPGVQISVVRHPELGQTMTRSDGLFDLAINGGGAVTLRYAKAGYIETQRLVPTQWNDQKVLDDVLLIGFDQNVTVIAMGAASAQVARGTRMTDGDGARTATLIFPAGESATITAPDGGTASVLHIRATEFTVGPSGPAAMPAALPPMSAYTYCVELSADEAPASSVQFAKPVSFYLDNFIGLPTGTIVPAGYYDRAKNAWIGSTNGRVIKILSVVSGVAFIDANGDGIPDDIPTLANLGIDDAERTALGALYSAGTSLWRVSVTHFSSWDFNLPPTGPTDTDDAVAPNEARPDLSANTPDSRAACTTQGSIVDCTNQGLGESIPIQGTPYSLQYDSARARSARFYQMRIHLSKAVIPRSLVRIDLKVIIAGAERRMSFPAQPNLDYTFVWDGLDGYGRPVQGSRVADIEITYVYPMTYGRSLRPLAWNLPADASFAERVARAAEYKLTQKMSQEIGQYDTSSTGFGQWTFSAQRSYDGIGRAIYDSPGMTRSADPQQTGQKAMVAAVGTGACCSSPDGTLATKGAFDWFWSMASSPDGSIYVIEDYRIRKVDPNGILSTLAGTSSSGFTPDGALALNHPVNPQNLAVAPDGALYVIDGNRVRTIVNGKWVTVAGNGSFYVPSVIESSDGVQATSIGVSPVGIAFGPDGALYIAAGYVLRVDVDGRIYRLAGRSGKPLYSGDEGLALNAGVTALDVAVGTDGVIYISDNQRMLRKITPDGIIHRIAGLAGGASTPLLQSGQPGTSGALWPQGISVAPDGTLVAVDLLGHRAWRFAPNGTAIILAGNGRTDQVVDPTRPFGSLIPPPNGSLGLAIPLVEPFQARVAPDGSVLVNDYADNVVWRADAMLPRVQTAATVIPSSDGSIAYVFEAGRHTRTVETLTGATLATLAYDSAGRLISITDADGLITRIERDGSGEATAIVAPNGQRTTLTISNGHLTGITEPSGASYAFEYDVDALLTKLTDRRGGEHLFAYDIDGFLQRDSDPAGGFIGLSRTGSDRNYTVTRTSAEGRTQSYRTAGDATGSFMRTHIDAAGLQTLSTFFAASSSLAMPDGSASNTTSAPDPRFGMLTPVDSLTLTTGSKILRITRSRSASFDPNNFLSINSVSETVDVNGKRWTSTYDAVSRVTLQQSPGGRRSSTTRDVRGRVVLIQQPTFADVSIAYDSRGRLASMVQGARTSTFAYDELDRLTSVTDPLHRTVSFGYDGANRVISQTRPDGNTIAFSYDAADNLTSVTPPSRPQHVFTSTPMDLESSYTPPVSATMRFTYNRDRQLTAISRPDDSTIAFGYDAAARLSTITSSVGTHSYAYDAAGRLANITAPESTVTFAFDGSLITTVSSAGAVAGTIAYTYDADLRQISESVNGSSIAFGYDADGLLTSAGALSLARSSQNGLLTGTTISAVSDSFGYDLFGDLASYSATAAATPLFSESFVRDDVGRIVQKSETFAGSTSTTSYGYDAAGRLSSVTSFAGTTTYTYDENGNRLSRTAPGMSESGTYDVQDRMLTYGGATYAYSANGELKSRTDTSGTTTYVYDAFGNLRHVTLADGRIIDYMIDAANHRVGKKINGTLVQGWLYSGARIVAETDGTGVVVSRFVYGSHMNTPDYVIRNGVTYRIITDQIGSVRLIVNAANGDVATGMNYDEYGRALTYGGFVPFGFAGGLYDADTQLIRFGARDYDPLTGRWTAQEPLGFAGGDANLYAYAFSDPINLIDPNGLYAGWDDAAFAAGGAVVGAGGQALADAISGHFSGWGAYGRAAVGGAVGGLVTLYAGPVAGGAAGAALTNALNQNNAIRNGTQCGFNWSSLALDTAIGAGTGKLFSAGNMSGGVRNGSAGHVFKSMRTALRNGTITNIQPATGVKMFAGAAEEYQIGLGTATGVVGSIASGQGGDRCGCR